jgi:hypothetical protein
VKLRYPIADLVDGWFFRAEEVSAGVYAVEGTDLWGRTVARKGANLDELLTDCANDARGIVRSLET